MLLRDLCTLWCQVRAKKNKTRGPSPCQRKYPRIYDIRRRAARQTLVNISSFFYCFMFLYIFSPFLTFLFLFVSFWFYYFNDVIESFYIYNKIGSNKVRFSAMHYFLNCFQSRRFGTGLTARTNQHGSYRIEFSLIIFS